MMRKLLVLLLAAAGTAAAAPQETASFEVASIKPNVSGAGNRTVRPSPGRLSIFNLTLKDLITFAYQVRDFQVSGGPGWINSDQYDIEAKAEGNPSQDQMRLMLQALLQDRFKLALHHDTKELPIYELTVAKGGLKLQPLKPGDCIVFDRDHPPAPGQKSSAYCGNLSNGRGSFDASNASMADIARMFSFQLGRVVVDKTGITGEFPVHLKFAPDEVAGVPPPADAGPSFFTAVQEQLGLKVESAKGPVEVLIIDHAEKPSED
jgi:uncharacterized protein (TIGR03435 family)